MSANMRSALFMVLSMLGYSINDTFAKLADESIDLYQIIFIRGILITFFLFLFIVFLRPPTSFFVFRSFIFHPMLSVRIIGEMSSTIFFLLALFNLPIANATAIIQLVPLVITAGAALFFKERIGLWRLLAILMGFVGVLFIVRPTGTSFNYFSLYAILAVFAITIRDMATHRLPVNTPTLYISFTTSIMITVMAAIGSQFYPWQSIGLETFLYIFLASISLTFGYIFSVMTMRVGEISFSSPFRYSVILWALLTGYIVWSEVPNFWETIGIFLIIAGGLLAYYREHRQR